VYWDRTWVSECGTLLCERDIGDGRVSARLALGGKICGSVGTLKLRGFALWCRLNLPLLKVTRLDIAIDDFDKHIKPHQIIKALQEDEYTGFKKADIVINHDRNWGGWCLYLGKRESDKVVRYYDKYSESRGKVNSYRWELESHDDYSDAIFSAWCECTQSEEEIQHLLVNYAIGQLRFLHKTSKNLSRCENLDWWDEFINFLCSIPNRICITRIMTSVERKIEWVRRSVAKSLAVINDAVGESRMFDLMADAIESARLRYTSSDELAIDKYKTLIDC
jgi:DNA relaxase NicK